MTTQQNNIEREKESTLSGWIYEHSALVIRTAFYYVKDEMVAEDIAQEVFLRAYRHMDDYRGEANLATWLYRITVNACKDYMRTWSHRKRLLAQMVQGPEANASAEQEALQKLNDDELSRRVMALPIKYREVIVLHYFEHLKSREIAEMLDLKESTVRVRISRGVAKLKEELIGGATAWIM
ncbi:MAG: sigma-70 family RNA polymerase sigma factor [Tumebacillaceae bacterium]